MYETDILAALIVPAAVSGLLAIILYAVTQLN